VSARGWLVRVCLSAMAGSSAIVGPSSKRGGGDGPGGAPLPSLSPMYFRVKAVISAWILSSQSVGGICQRMPLKRSRIGWGRGSTQIGQHR